MIKITCHTNDPYEGDSRTLATFEDEDPGFDRQKARYKALHWLDDMLNAVKGCSLFEELNEIQAECNQGLDPQPFPKKTEMPLCILNLVLKEHGLELKED